MHNVNVGAVEQTAAKAASDPGAVTQHVSFDVDADAPAHVLDELKRAADEHCPGAYCIRNPIDLRTRVTVIQPASSH